MPTTKLDAVDREKVLLGYIECLLWTEEERLNDQWLWLYGKECNTNHALSAAAYTLCESDVHAFLDYCEMEGIDIPEFWTCDPARIGHDLWLTRNGHGAGFWDRGQGEAGEKLSRASKYLGGVTVYLSEREVHLCP